MPAADRSLRMAVLVALVGLAASLGAALQLQASNEASLSRHFDTLSDEYAELIRERLRVYEYGLRGLRGAVVAVGPERLTRVAVERYVSTRDIDREFPGARGMGFIRRVPRADEADFVAAARADGAADFTVRELAPHGGERRIIQYVYPAERNAGATGVDIGSEPARREAADAAMRENAPRLTAPITLAQAREKPGRGLLLLLPVYRSEQPLASEEERVAATVGWTYAPLVVDEVLRQLGFRDDEIAFELTDTEARAVGEATAFYRSHADGGPALPGLSRSQALVVFGRPWRLQTRALPDFVSRAGLVSPLLLGSNMALLSLTLAAATGLLLRLRQQRLELHQQEERLAIGIVETLPQALVVIDEGGRIVRANRGAAELFGYDTQALQGLAIGRLLSRDIRTRVAATPHDGDPLAPAKVCKLSLQGYRRDASMFPASVSLAPLELGAQILIVAGIEDMSAQRAALDLLARDEQRWRELAASLPQLVWTCTPAGSCDYLSPQWCEYAGRAEGELRGLGWFEHVHPDDQPALAQAWQQAVETVTPFRTEFRIRRHDGVYRWFFTSALPALDERGAVLRWVGSNTDIEQRRHAEAELQALNASLEGRIAERTVELEAAKRDLQAILDAVPASIGYWDRQLRNRFANHAYKAWFGIEPSELHGRHLRELHGERYETLRPHVEAALRGEAQNFEQSFLTPDGERHGIVRYIPDVQAGEVLGYYALVQDVTALTESRRALQTERERLDAIITGTNAGTWEWNVQTGETRFNERWAGIIGYTLAELQPTDIGTWMRFAHPDDLAVSNERLQQHFAGATDQYECEARMRHRDGRWVWVLDRGRVTTRTPDGRPEWMHGTHLDVTASREARQQLAASQALLDRTGRVAGVGGWELDLASQRLSWTSVARRLIGLGADAQMDLPAALQLCPPDARRQVEAALAAATADGRPFDIEVPLHTLDGRRLWVRVVGEAERDGDGDTRPPARLVGALQDVTEHHATEEALRAAKRTADAASAAKSEFLANMSHEIRTPMNAVIGLAHLLERTRLDPDQRDSLAKLQAASRSLLGVINDVLDLAKIEAGGVTLEAADFVLADLLADLRAMFEPQARARDLVFVLACADDVPAVLCGDALRLQQILVNLLGNAIKFTERGTVELQIARAGEREGQIGLRCAVRDTGPGLAPDIIERLFRPFTQADTSTTRHFGGTGLGLSIVRQLADLMGGQAGVTSRLGEGSEFWVEVWLGPGTPQATSAGGRSAGPAPLQVLIAAADEAQREVLTSMAGGLGWQVVALAGGDEALGRLREHDAHAPPIDVLLLDGRPPGVDGAAVLAALEREPLPAAPRPAALLLSVEPAEQLRRAPGAALADGILQLPFSPSELFNAVNAAVTARGVDADRVVAAAPLGSGAAQWLPDTQLLLVDDNDINLEVARRILEGEGAQLTVRRNGEEALECLRQRTEPFDLILMDVQMPVMDGLQATRRLRDELGLDAIPVIALTAGALVAERQRALEAGMTDFVSKPFDPRLLVRTVRRRIERYRREPLAVRDRVDGPAAVAARWPVVDGIDTVDAALRLNDDLSLFARMLGRLLTEFAAWIDAPPAWPAGRAERRSLAAGMHKLRGAAGMLGAYGVQAIASRIEALVQGDGDAVEGQTQCLALSSALRSLRNASASVRQTVPPPSPIIAAAEPPGAAALAEFVALLHRQDLAALDRYEDLAPGLLALCGAQRHAVLHEALHGLDFARAAGLLSGASPMAATAPD